jgi:hypothetical protein
VNRTDHAAYTASVDSEPKDAVASQLDAIREQLERIHDEAIRGRLLKILVLWTMDYSREAVSQFRLTAERALHRLVDRAGQQAGTSAAAGEALLQRGQSSKAVEWLHRDVRLLPARMALHLHTLLAWGSFASHHQEAGHEVEIGVTGPTIGGVRVRYATDHGRSDFNIRTETR